ncbi:MAG: alpha-mannosidase, partial [Ruminococcaceae bacterium]|nr:alpha-mannosidase [Oscillospiraceae bacterium]
MKNSVYLIGNAHLDPVWLWRFQEGFAEIKATFRSALDRIAANDDFVFTSACASYYKWVEENCPSMFEEIRAAVKAKKWAIVGGMWIQPDCNMPSAESFARHFLYSQRYFREKFGVSVRTGYNVDSFGHNAALPKLLRQGGIENYIYMRPSPVNEMAYPFSGEAFRWQCDGEEVAAYRLPEPYCFNLRDDERLRRADEAADGFSHDLMFFYGVGNHGGGPTITNLKIIHEFQPKASRDFVMASPDTAFDAIRARSYDKLPVYVGELQNHASGCYSANSRIKALNRDCENRLSEAERMESLAAVLADLKPDTAKNAEAWQAVLFNQFHDILCGCSVKAAYDDAYAFGGAALHRALTLTNAAAQRISWSIDTSKGVAVLTKEMSGMVWEADDLGTPVVVFNPTSHPVRVPVSVHTGTCAAVTDEHDNLVPWQIIRADYTNGGGDKYFVHFRPEIPALGWKTFWVYQNRSFGDNGETTMEATPTMLKNDRITVTFDETTGGIASVKLADGRELLGSRGTR